MIVITTSSGQIGRQVLDHLLDSKEKLRVIVRDPSALSADVRQRVEVIEGSPSDAAVVEKAFAGADAGFWLLAPNPRALSVEAAYVDFARPASAAFRSQGIRRVVGVSALGRGTPWADKASYGTASPSSADTIASGGVAYRPLTSPSFMDNILRQAASIKNQGVFFSPIAGDGRRPGGATRDIPAAASRLLRDASWSGVSEVPLLGPEDLSFNDIAEIISDVIGKQVRFQQITFEAFEARFVSSGMSDVMAQGNTDMAWAKNEGLD